MLGFQLRKKSLIDYLLPCVVSGQLKVLEGFMKIRRMTSSTSSWELRSGTRTPNEQPLLKLQQNHTAYVDVFPTHSIGQFSRLMSFAEEAKVQKLIPIPTHIHIGSSLDVCSLLCSPNRDYLVRNNGDRVPITTLKNKSVVLCCFSIPLRPAIDNYVEKLCIALVNSYTESSRSDFEMVVVVKIRSDCYFDQEQQKAAFNSFLSSFTCLTIPFSDTCGRDYVADCLCLTDEIPISSLVVDPLHNVVHLGYCPFFLDYGAFSFPFTDHKLQSLIQEDERMISRLGTQGWYEGPPTLPPPTLDELLYCKPSDLLYRNNNNKETVSVSDLKQKLVGLYLCMGGDYIPELNDLHQECKVQGLEFEIVMVYLPFLGEEEVEELQTRISLELEELNISDWWVSPYKDMVSRRLWRVSGYFHADSLIILGPCGKFIESFGRVFTYDGVSVYPFSTEVYVDKHVARLRSLTLESLLTISGEQSYLVRGDGSRVPVTELRGRNVLLFVAGREFLEKGVPLYDQVCDWYTEIKCKDPGFEVVYIATRSEKLAWDEEPFSSTQWLGYPQDTQPILEELFLQTSNCFPTCITFGEDGKIRAIDVHKGTIDTYQSEKDMHRLLLDRLKYFIKDLSESLYGFI